MDSVIKQKGSCLCGSVNVSATPKSYHVGACHCSMCRKWGGGPLLVVECEDDVRFESNKDIRIYSSSDFAERGFCQQCGSHLFYRFKDGGFYAIPVGLFDEKEKWQLAEQVFIDNKPTYYSFADKTRNLTEAEIIAQFSDN